jgi:hypothetical protein
MSGVFCTYNVKLHTYLTTEYYYLPLTGQRLGSICVSSKKNYINFDQVYNHVYMILNKYVIKMYFMRNLAKGTLNTVIISFFVCVHLIQSQRQHGAVGGGSSVWLPIPSPGIDELRNFLQVRPLFKHDAEDGRRHFLPYILYIQERINEICGSRMCARVHLQLFLFMFSFLFRSNTYFSRCLNIFVKKLFCSNGYIISIENVLVKWNTYI